MRDRRSPFPPCTRLATLAVACLAFVAGRPATAAGPTPAAPPATAVLHLADDGYVPGAMKDSVRPGVLRWQGAGFVAPFEFDLSRVNAVHYPVPPVPPRPVGDYCFELAGGDLLFGALVDLNESVAVLDVPRLGRLHVRRDDLHRLHRWRDSAELVYLGPNGLTGWREVTTDKEKSHGWREQSGQLVSSYGGSSIRADLGLPARAAVEFEVSWEGRPDFVLALGVGDDPKASGRAFRFEVWEDDLVLQRETEDEADVASVGVVSNGPGRAHLCVYLDQDAGRAVVTSDNGKPLADLKVRGPRSPALGGVLLENKRGSVRLERLKITRWDGDPPREAATAGNHLQRLDGSVVDGRVSRYDPAAKEFVVLKGGEETRVPESRVAGVSLSTPGEVPQRAARATFLDGTRLSGDLIRVEGGSLVLSVSGIKETPGLPVDGLRSLAFYHRADGSSVPPPGSSARLEMEGVRLHGRLVDGREQPDSSCLAWQPNGSATASPLRPGTSGRVVYREPPPPAPAPAPQPPMNGRVIMRVQPAQPRPLGGLQGFVSGFAGSRPSQAASPAGRALHLRTGDVIPSEVTKIDENGVTFRSTLTQNTFVSHEKIKAVELAPALPTTVRLNRSKRERLLTLPRMQKGSPPTQLVRSRNGDYLRGRVTGMDGRTVRVESRLETRELPRDRVSRIIWLHADELDDPKSPATAPRGRQGPTRVQAVCNDGVRLTFSPDRLADGTLSGKSDVLGKCQVRLGDVGQLLIGGAIEQAAAKLVYQQWKLQNAPEPAVAQDDGAAPNGRAPGTESALVGKPAPDFELDLLGGKTFRLSESKGRVVVLDFWATWCGPCLQAMPQVDRVTREFADQGVRLVAVNLQEAPKAITAMLERHKLRMTVALDRDGAVAGKYEANAIPQTVVIGRDGNVARLFVGGGPHLGDQLRDAIKAALPAAAKEPTE